MNLLSLGNTNAKTIKNEKYGNYLSAILYLAPSTLSGINLCPNASKGCKQACLNTAGRGRFNNVKSARLRRTMLFNTNKPEFFKQLIEDIEYLKRKAVKESKQLVIRLNGTSDIDWESIEIPEEVNGQSVPIIRLYSDITFYDYTKSLKRLIFNKYPNYHLIFSASESNTLKCRIAVKLGHNVAVVFKKLPEKFWNRKVINGDLHDLRFIDEKKTIVGLIAKGYAKKDITGFVKG